MLIILKLEVWYKPLDHDKAALLFFNRRDDGKSVTFNYNMKQVPEFQSCTGFGFEVTDVWNGTITTIAGENYRIEVEAHAAQFVTAVPLC